MPRAKLRMYQPQNTVMLIAGILTIRLCSRQLIICLLKSTRQQISSGNHIRYLLILAKKLLGTLNCLVLKEMEMYISILENRQTKQWIPRDAS